MKEFVMPTDTEVEERLSAGRMLINTHLEDIIDEALESGHGEVAKLAGEVLLSGGKRMRPLLILQSFAVAGGTDEEEVLPLALAFELIHTATLVHDDINDNAKLRRGIPTIHERAGSEKALIAGDWLFVQGFRFGGGYSQQIVSLLANCCARIASSELKQLAHIHDLSTSPEDYYSIVRGKTAGPFAAGCQAAALLAGASNELATKLGEFGMEMGVAFQIVDDLLDILGDERMGKPRGTDVIEGKMTLPLIHALTMLHGDARTRLSQVITGFHDGLWDELVDLLNAASSLDYARTLVRNHLDRALELLRQFPETESRRSVEILVEAVMNRHA